MASILDSIRNKNKNRGRDRAVRSSFAEKLMKHRLTVIYRSVLIIVLLVALVWVLITQMKNRVFRQWQEISFSEGTINTGSGLMTLGENALFYSHDGAYCVDKKGQTTWNQTYEMQEPIVDIRGSQVAIADYNGHSIYIMSSQSTKGIIDTGMPIKNIAVSAAGVVAAVLDDSDNITWIYLYDENGNEIAYFKTTMNQSGYPIKVSISDNGNLVGVSYVYMDRTVLKSSVAFYNFGPVGRNEIDNFVSSYDYTNAVIPFIRFLGDDACFAAGDSRLTFYEGSQKPVSVAENLVDGEIRGLYWGKDNVAVVFNDISGQSQYRIDIYNKAGKLEESLNCDLQFADIIFKNNKIVIYNSQRVIYHTIGGMTNYEGEFPEQIMRLIPLSNAHEFMAVCSNGIKVLRLT